MQLENAELVEDVVDEARYIVEWADEIIDSALSNRPSQFPRMSPKRYMSMVSEDGKQVSMSSNALKETFEPGDFLPGPMCFRALVLTTLLQRYSGYNHADFAEFSENVEKVALRIEEEEHWVKDPLTDDELVALHSFFHDAMEKLAMRNGGHENIEEWSEDDKLLATRIFIALSYVLAWQKYTRCVLFLFTLASPWVCQLSDSISSALASPAMLKLHTELFCTTRRFNHFELLIHGYGENVGSVDAFSDLYQGTMDASRFGEEEEE